MVADLIGGQVEFGVVAAPAVAAHIKSGSLRAIGVMGKTRVPSMPDLPTIAEAGVPGYAAEPWYTLSAPRGVPAEVMRKLNADIAQALRAPELVQRFEALGVTPLGGSLEDASRRNALEAERWTRVIQAASITVD